MTGKKLQRVLACLLAVLLLSQVGAFSPAVFAADSSGYTLHDGTAVIPAGTSKDMWTAFWRRRWSKALGR